MENQDIPKDRSQKSNTENALDKDKMIRDLQLKLTNLENLKKKNYNTILITILCSILIVPLFYIAYINPFIQKSKNEPNSEMLENAISIQTTNAELNEEFFFDAFKVSVVGVKKTKSYGATSYWGGLIPSGSNSSLVIVKLIIENLDSSARGFDPIKVSLVDTMGRRYYYGKSYGYDLMNLEENFGPGITNKRTMCFEIPDNTKFDIVFENEAQKVIVNNSN